LDISPSRTYGVEGGMCRTRYVEVEGFGCFGCVRDVHVDFGWPWLFEEVFRFVVCSL